VAVFNILPLYIVQSLNSVKHINIGKREFFKNRAISGLPVANRAAICFVPQASYQRLKPGWMKAVHAARKTAESPHFPLARLDRQSCRDGLILQ
jgi:hypothetical protein